MNSNKIISTTLIRSFLPSHLRSYSSPSLLSGPSPLVCFSPLHFTSPSTSPFSSSWSSSLQPQQQRPIFDFSTHVPFSPMNILVYSGDGVSRTSLTHTVHNLRYLVGQHYDVMKIDAQGLETEPWEESTSLLVIPGGRDLPFVRDLSGPINKRIRNYVHSGGRFFGICAGAYYGADRITFESGSPLHVEGARELKFFPGECRGAVYPGFVYESEKGANAVSIWLNKEVFAQDQLGFEEVKVYFNGGGYFVDADKCPGTQILAWYQSEQGQIDHHSTTPKAAMVACQVGQGLAVLTGVHPEYDASRLDPRNPDYGPQPNVVTRLMEREHERRIFLRSVLAKMGLKVSQPEPTNITTVTSAPNGSALPSGMCQSGVPAITSLYLTSIDPSYTAELSRILSRLANAEGQIQEANDTFQLVPSPHHPVPVHTLTTIETEEGEAEEKITKNIVLCPDEPPPTALTPEFDMGRYFRHLRQVRQQINETETQMGHYSQRSPFSSRDNEYTFGNSLMYGQVVTSTQTMLDKNFSLCQELPDGFVCNATIQVSGRGRGRNSWISPPGCLQFSLTLRHPVQAGQNASAVFIQYLMALAVVEGVCSMPGYEDLPLRLKWPNDIYAEAPLEHPSQIYSQSFAATGGGRPKMIKIGGILVNSNFNGSEFLLVIGCGVNTTNPNPTTSINHLIRYHNKITGKDLALLSQETVLAQVLVKFEQLYKQFLGRNGQGGFQQFEEMYYKRWLHSDAIVTLTTLSPHKRVRIKGITLDFGLLRTVKVDDQGRDIPGEKEYHLQPDGNSFDMLKGLISQKS
ncbi:biotin holocarboxylase synthetase [Lobosporangium transversale]|uniref:Biotin-protein ligase n=1 Tax=Lobosporangium transversale TaxID=64571 RepID=A0A1Y2GQX3_9FUNG|nr:biotin-protein ligase [Lobosporangium transversale]KAF9904260.1 biotin holocarboxylase synthetase [Lobosporangium transversale]ORZ17542.1 biotin-protein ligase [Lobosporangium transversale]|eukprot:XP_021881929.1 biotin-protein ligase [Lobosporangium transversale]